MRSPENSDVRFVEGVRLSTMQDEADYLCDACGEEIVIPVDLAEGVDQEYVEDCPACCRPNVVHIHVEANGDIRIWAEGE